MIFIKIVTVRHLIYFIVVVNLYFNEGMRMMKQNDKPLSSGEFNRSIFRYHYLI